MTTFRMTIQRKTTPDPVIFLRCTQQMITDTLRAQSFGDIESIVIDEDEESVRHELRMLRNKMYRDRISEVRK